MFSFVGGRRFANDLADSLGIERNLLGTALLERGITWKHLNAAKQAGATLGNTAIALKGEVLAGLDALEARFGRQDEIDAARRRLDRLVPSVAEAIATDPVPGRPQGPLLDSMKRAGFSEKEIAETVVKLSSDPDQRLGE